EHRGIQEKACGALCIIAVHVDNETEVVNEGGLEAVVTAMQTHPFTEGVQEYGCWALLKVAWTSARI
ncbi:hypothetical protein T484DRAFT_1854148, partial [Baffinella frigidus]